ncbi:MAG: hypothetical protein PHW75_02165 [Patescibacteria group bacterium]|nr:hypothetical protein [Patescibacteria group bacterium]
MPSKFVDRIKELEPKHYVFILVFVLIFTGAIYGIIEYRQGNLSDEVTSNGNIEEGVEEEPLTEVPEAPKESNAREEVSTTQRETKKSTTTSYNELNDSGPETLWIGEIATLTGSALLWGVSRKNKKNKDLS